MKKNKHLFIKCILYTTLIISRSVYADSMNIPPLPYRDLKVLNWYERKYHEVIKQEFDYSCGASSLATILTFFYKKPTSEKTIIEDMNLSDSMASFNDLASVSKKYGFVAKGITTSYDTLLKIKIPVIVYLNHNRNDHFTVVRAIDTHRVYLSDSNWGNRILSKKQFEKMWNTIDDTNYKGKVLIILPEESKLKLSKNSSYTEVIDTQKLLRETPKLFRNIY